MIYNIKQKINFLVNNKVVQINLIYISIIYAEIITKLFKRENEHYKICSFKDQVSQTSEVQIWGKCVKICCNTSCLPSICLKHIYQIPIQKKPQTKRGTSLSGISLFCIQITAQGCVYRNHQNKFHDILTIFVGLPQRFWVFH